MTRCSLHWLSVRRRVTLKSIVIAWKCVNGVAPTYLPFYESYVSQWMMSVVDHDCGPRQLAASYKLQPRPSSSDLYWIVELRVQRSCSVNSLPPALRESMSLAIQDKTENVYFPAFTMTLEDHPALLLRFRDICAAI